MIKYKNKILKKPVKSKKPVKPVKSKKSVKSKKYVKSKKPVKSKKSLKVKKSSKDKKYSKDKQYANNKKSRGLNIYEKLNNKKTLKKSIVKNTHFLGTGLDLIFGLIYLASKYKNLDIPFKFKKSYGYDRDDFMNYGIRFDCNDYEKTQRLIYPLHKDKFFKLIKNSKKRFVGIFLYIQWDCYNSSAHFNSILFDKKNKTVERFEPYTKFIDKHMNITLAKFDKVFNKSIKNNLGYKYILPHSFCPNIGFQQKDENNLLSVLTPSTIGNYQFENDPGGFCGAWSLYYLNLRIANPNVDSKKLLNNIYKYLDKDKHSFRTFIRNYSEFIYKKRSKLLKNHKNNLNGINTLLEDKFSLLINR